ncbi:MAG: hypothetical protein N2C13_02350 [Chloroflexota bacterium]
MSDADLLANYNYDEFVPHKFGPWMRFDESPPLGTTAPDFPLWNLKEEETSLSSIWSENLYPIVEFGSFT